MTKHSIAPETVAIRRARREDAARIASLIMHGAPTATMTPAEIEAEAGHPAYVAAFEEVNASLANTLFVAERAGEVVGTFQVTIIPGLAARGRKRAKIESVHVAPKWRGRGIGGLMIAHALAFAELQGAGIAELTSNKDRVDAHRFYRDLGFDQSHEGFKKLL